MPPMPFPSPTGPGSVGPIVSGPYIGGSNTNGRFPPNRGGFNSAGPISRPINTAGPTQPPYSGLPGQATAPTGPPNVLGPGAVRPTGPSSGFDPQYLQNLATAIGGLFSRPGGSLNFNPLGNLSDLPSPNLGTGNAPLPGIPSTMLQDAINGLAFLFNPAAPAATGGGNSVVGGGGDTGNRGRRLQ